jgi:hypothetical protein
MNPTKQTALRDKLASQIKMAETNFGMLKARAEAAKRCRAATAAVRFRLPAAPRS